MRQRLLDTEGWLLQKVPLANDDVLLVFLTKDYGKIKVFASRLQRSKKKNAELDYFRWLELSLSQPKQSFKLSGVRALTDFASNLHNYDRIEFGFEALGFVSLFCPEEKEMPEIIQLLHELFTLNTLPLPVLQAYFCTKLLWFTGVLPRFDTIREAIWVDPITLAFATSELGEGTALTNQQRQLLEYLRRVDAMELLDKHQKFKEPDLFVLQGFLFAVIKNH